MGDRLDQAAKYLFDLQRRPEWCGPWDEMKEAVREHFRERVREVLARSGMTAELAYLRDHPGWIPPIPKE